MALDDVDEEQRAERGHDQRRDVDEVVRESLEALARAMWRRQDGLCRRLLMLPLRWLAIGVLVTRYGGRLGFGRHFREPHSLIAPATPKMAARTHRMRRTQVRPPRN